MLLIHRPDAGTFTKPTKYVQISGSAEITFQYKDSVLHNKIVFIF